MLNLRPSTIDPEGEGQLGLRRRGGVVFRLRVGGWCRVKLAGNIENRAWHTMTRIRPMRQSKIWSAAKTALSRFIKPYGTVLAGGIFLVLIGGEATQIRNGDRRLRAERDQFVEVFPFPALLCQTNAA